jgi:LuxR family transcriptional regulator, maltose regulon positive regulatory protein
MPFTLLASKLYIPALRLQLITRLNEVLRLPATILSALVGFGNIALFSTWLPQLPTSTHAAWITLDEGDNDLARFLAYPCSAL